MALRNTTRRHNPQDSDLNFHRRENLKSRIRAQGVKNYAT